MWRQSSGSVGQSIQINPPPPTKKTLYTLYIILCLYGALLLALQSQRLWPFVQYVYIVWNMDLISKTLWPICHRVSLGPKTFIYAKSKDVDL